MKILLLTLTLGAVALVSTGCLAVSAHEGCRCNTEKIAELTAEKVVQRLQNPPAEEIIADDTTASTPTPFTP